MGNTCSWFPALRCAPAGRTPWGYVSRNPNPLHPTHIGRERRRHRDAAIRVLVILQHRDQRPADRHARAVERMREARALALPGPVARAHAPGLEVGADRAA